MKSRKQYLPETSSWSILEVTGVDYVPWQDDVPEIEVG